MNQNIYYIQIGMISFPHIFLSIRKWDFNFCFFIFHIFSHSPFNTTVIIQFTQSGSWFVVVVLFVFNKDILNPICSGDHSTLLWTDFVIRDLAKIITITQTLSAFLKKIFKACSNWSSTNTRFNVYSYKFKCKK